MSEPLVERALRQYPFTVRSIRVENEKGKKGVRWLDTDAGLLVLKRSPNPPARTLFVIAAMRHLRHHGVRIPSLIETRSGSPFAEVEGVCFLASEVAPGRPPVYSSPAELDAILGSLAQFHAASRGFFPPPTADPRVHLGLWEASYERRIEALQGAAAGIVAARTGPGGTADAQPCRSDAVAGRILEEIPRFILQARRAMEHLQGGPYERAVRRVAMAGNICHQDFASGNLSIAPDGMYVFDLDSVTLDLEARDLRKIVNKVMKKSGSWQSGVLHRMLQAYQAVNPLSHDDYTVLKADLMFPHLFTGIVDKCWRGRASEWSTGKLRGRLEETIELEKDKEGVLASFDEIVHSLIPPPGGVG